MRSITLCLVAAVLCAGPVYAEVYAQPNTGFWLAGGADFFWLNSASTRTIFMGGTQPPIPDYYYPNSAGQVSSYEFSLGYQFCNIYGYPLSYRVGLLYQSDLNTDTTGDIKDADQVDYHYRYSVTARALFLELQVDLFPNQYLGPYVELALGASRNEISDYTETTLPNQVPRASAAFNKHALVTTAYRVGLGGNYQFEVAGSPCQVSLAYVYTNLGEARTGDSDYYKQIAGHRLNQRLSGFQLEMMLRVYLE